MITIIIVVVTLTEKKSASLVKGIFLAYCYKRKKSYFVEHPWPLADVIFWGLAIIASSCSILIWENTETPSLSYCGWFGSASLVVNFFLGVIIFLKLSAHT